MEYIFFKIWKCDRDFRLILRSLIKILFYIFLSPVPEYKFVTIRMKKSDPFQRGHSYTHRISQRGGASNSPADMFIVAESVFGHSVQMQLRRNDKLVAPSFRAFSVGDGDIETEMTDRTFPVCHYIGNNGSIAAAVSDCHFGSSRGLVSSASLIML